MSQRESLLLMDRGGKRHYRELDSKMPRAMFGKELSESNRRNLMLLEWEYFPTSAEMLQVFAGWFRFRAHLLMQSRHPPADWCFGWRIGLLSTSPENQRGVALSLNSTTLIIGSRAEVDTQLAPHSVCLSNDSSSLIPLLQSLMGADKASWSVTASSMWPSQTISSRTYTLIGCSGQI